MSEYIPPIGGGPDDSYVDVNEGAGVDGSAVPAAAIENPQRDIKAVVELAGLTPTGSDHTQLSAAIALMAKLPPAFFTVSNIGSQQGLLSVPAWDGAQWGNVTIQWGVVSTSVNEAIVTFPTPYTSPPAMLLTDVGANNLVSVSTVATTTEFGVTSNAASSAYWFAFGE